MIDIGVNLSNKRFDKDRDEVILAAKHAGVDTMILTGTSIAESQQVVALCQLYPNMYCTAGVHPHDADGVSTNYLETLQDIASNNKVVAIGECGLDFNRNFSTPDNQQRVFAEQLELATTLQLPVFLHQRDAFDPWSEILKSQLAQLPNGVSHCFTGNLRELKACLDMGLYIGITGWICDERRGQELYDIARYIPLDRVMIETDAPYLTPRNIRPRPKSSRNEPKYLPYVASTLAQAMQVEEAKIIEQTRANSKTFFNL
ncbi:TatD family hydrolase [Thalassotalea aquiviva]|uniref:TatD family hydrolase n=1 Tax=Thalassotalea aquiviva TaxID=3242415 RepID=UPI00352BC109